MTVIHINLLPFARIKPKHPFLFAEKTSRIFYTTRVTVYVNAKKVSHNSGFHLFKKSMCYDFINGYKELAVCVNSVRRCKIINCIFF